LKDVPRTNVGGVEKQRALFAVLKCLVINFPELGYLQGMNFLAATLMRHNTPQDTLMILISLFETYGMRGYFEADLRGLKKDFYIFLSLMKKYMPKVYNKMRKDNYIPQIYA